MPKFEHAKVMWWASAWYRNPILDRHTHARLKTLPSPFSKWRIVNQNQRGVTHNEQKYAKETVFYKQVLVVSELFNIAGACCKRTF